MDFQFWLYVIIGVVYLISRLMKKSDSQGDFPEGPEKPVPRPQQRNPSTTDEAPRELTFEELLREITEGKTVQRQAPAVPAPPRPTPYSSYEDVTADEEEDLEDEEFDHSKQDRTMAVYEEAKRQAFLRPSLEETMSLKDTDMTFGRFKGFEKERVNPVLKEFLGDMNDPNAWKKAVIMSEILQRKF